MKDTDGQKYFSDKEKCDVMEKTWKDVFKISDEEERSFDFNHSVHVDQFINMNINRVNTYPTVNINRLNTEIYHTREITTEEIKSYIKRSKKESPRLHQDQQSNFG